MQKLLAIESRGIIAHASLPNPFSGSCTLQLILAGRVPRNVRRGDMETLPFAVRAGIGRSKPVAWELRGLDSSSCSACE